MNVRHNISFRACKFKIILVVPSFFGRTKINMMCFDNDRLAKKVKYFILYCGTLLKGKFRQYFGTRLSGYRLKIDMCATNHVQYIRIVSNFLPVAIIFYLVANPTTLK